MAAPIVGIDLGTTNSLVAICDERGPRIIPDEQGRPLLPSVVRYERRGNAIATTIGYDARHAAPQFPRTTIASVKRLMGRSRADAAPDLPFLGYEVVEGANNTARVALPLGPGDTHIVSPPEVSSVILRALKEQASRALGVEVTRAVVTVPAYFDDAQRQATRDAGRLAGLDVVRIVAEPTAAALAYGLGLQRESARNTLKAGNVVVYDLGGGTFDVSILRLTPATSADATSFFQVLSTSGDTHLGGDDVDHAIVDLITRENNLTLDPGARAILTAAAERAKCELSDRDSTTIEVHLPAPSAPPSESPRSGHGPVASGGAGAAPAQPVDPRAPHSSIGHSAAEPSQSAKAGALPAVAHSSELPGSGRIQRVLTRAELESLISPWIDRTIDACRRAVRDAARKLDTETLDLDAVVLVGGSTRIPAVRARVREFFKLDPYTALDPDQVIALGASVQAAVISGATRGSLLLDVIPLSLGIETVGGAVAKIIMRNSTVPTRATEMFSTSIDGQTSIKLAVYQGEREMAADCRSLGTFHLRGIPPMPAGIPQLEVEFLVDANGVLNVSATERRSGKRAALQVVPNHGLTRDEVDRIERESIEHVREDMTRHRIVDLIVNARLDVKWITERLTKHRAQLDPAYAAALDARLAEVKSFIDNAERDWTSVDPNAFHHAKDALDKESVRLQEVSISESLKSGA